MKLLIIVGIRIEWPFNPARPEPRVFRCVRVTRRETEATELTAAMERDGYTVTRHEDTAVLAELEAEDQEWA